MNRIEPWTSTAEDGRVVFRAVDDARWLLELSVETLDGEARPRRSPAESESFLLVLDGTHDLYAGSGSWMRRGVREAPTAGRPLGVFLPPDTRYQAENGRGRILVASTRQPELPPAEDPKDQLAKKPLLPLAGSGKSFDPSTGAWKPVEAFLGSPEAILPRRLERIECGDDGVVERVLGADYKALGLQLDEIVVAAGGEIASPPPPGIWPPDGEVAVWFETAGRGAELRSGEDRIELDGCGALRLDAPPTGWRAADDAPLFAVVVYAGPKAST